MPDRGFVPLNILWSYKIPHIKSWLINGVVIENKIIKWNLNVD